MDMRLKEGRAMRRRLSLTALGIIFVSLAITAFYVAGNPSRDALAYDGKIVVLTDRRVYSSAANFVDSCVSTGWATVVGEPVASDNSTATPAVVVLPKSRMLEM
ncbi:MAG: S41 family peptidase [Bacillota bacterium]